MKELEALREMFAPFDIEWRIQSTGTSNGKKWGRVLAYVTNRAIMDRLDDAVGADRWRNEFELWGSKGVKCGISIKIGDEWVTKYDGAEETNVEATKGGFSASMKRAGVQWGIGRYLYNLEATFVDFRDTKGDGYINYVKDMGYWKEPSLPTWALPKKI